LHVIEMSAGLLRERMADARTSAALDRIERAQRRMAVLINELLDLAKIEVGRFRVDVAPCRARSLVTDALALCAPMAEESGLRLESEAVEDVCILADRDRMLQVLENLLRNAIHFSPKGGSVSVAAIAAEGGSSRFLVRDEGPGIEPDVLPHVFDRYWQAPASGRRRGSGLGLYIAKGIVEAHGGRIWVESSLGAGSTFLFTVPSPASQTIGGG
jgi:signal transduction histidine kinase